MSKAFLLILILLIAAGVAAAISNVAHAPTLGPTAGAKTQSAHLLFVGDMFFDRSIRAVAEERGYDFLLSCVKNRFALYDAVVGNLEGPITDMPSVSKGSVVGSPENYTFTFAPEVAELLKRHNITIVAVGNNHIANQGDFGIVQTKEYLAAAEVESFGGVLAINDIQTKTGEPIHRTRISGQNISFISFNEFGGSSAEGISNVIAGEKLGGQFVVVFAHWGDEYVETPERVKKWAEQFAHAGADLIVGAHPHVVQGREVIGGTPIYYSLGNFLFDQYWNEAVRHGLALEVTITGGKISSLIEIPTVMYDDRRVCLGSDTPPEL